MLNIYILFKILKERRISAKKLSDDTGISTGNISDWKSGKCFPSISALITIADYLNISLDYLVGRTDNPILHKKSETLNMNREILSRGNRVDNGELVEGYFVKYQPCASKDEWIVGIVPDYASSLYLIEVDPKTVSFTQN